MPDVYQRTAAKAGAPGRGGELSVWCRRVAAAVEAIDPPADPPAINTADVVHWTAECAGLRRAFRRWLARLDAAGEESPREPPG